MRLINGPGIPAAGLPKSRGNESINKVNKSIDKVKTPAGAIPLVRLEDIIKVGIGAQGW